ncbi:hypothetical protein OF83DRAFT_1178920 [Amylostereum chailletii]|nr:hypothetical protein OF83DRAFT_1178920 [Amylostereum chailletii]
MDLPANTLSDSMASMRLVPNDPSPNPWDQVEENSRRRPTLKTPDPSTLDPAARESIQGDPREKVRAGNEHVDERHSGGNTDTEVLSAFDPLASPEEKAAQEAWADAEGHPPQIPPKQSSTTPAHSPSSSLQLSGPPEQRPSTPLSFPSFAAFARNFSLPNVNINNLVAGTGKGKTHSRPQSLDYATLMQTPTPHSAGSFSAQQDKTRSNLVPDDADAEVNARGSPKQSSSQPGSGTASPRHRILIRENDGSRPSSAGANRDRAKEGGDPPFDFQKFLDQMKARGAEPIAKYLRSGRSRSQTKSSSNITQEEFERNVEAAIQTLPTSRPQSPPIISASSSSSSSISTPPTTPHRGLHPADPIPVPQPLLPHSTHVGDEPATPLALPSIDAKRLLQRTGDSLSKPLNAIGRIFSEALDGAEDMITASFPHTPNNSISNTNNVPGASAPWVPPPAVQTPYKPRVRRVGTPTHSPAGSYTEETPSRPGPRSALGFGLASPTPHSTPGSRAPTPGVDTIDIPGMQAEIDRAHARAADAALGTLFQIFPTVDREVVEWVLEANGGDLGRSIEALLEMSGGG